MNIHVEPDAKALECLRIINENLKTLRVCPAEDTEMQRLIREIRDTTFDIWYSHGWNSSSIDC